VYLAFTIILSCCLILTANTIILLFVDSVGTDEQLVVSIICGRTNEEMDILKKKYFELFTKDLGSVLASETTGTLEYLCLNVLQGAEDSMDESVYNDEKMAKDIKTLYDAGQGKLGTKEKEIFKVRIAGLPFVLRALFVTGQVKPH